MILLSFGQCFSQAGAFDVSFGGAGVVHTNFFDLNEESEVARAVVIQPDGKILVAGTTVVPGAIIRYNIDGTLDNSFDDDGITYMYKLRPVAMVLQSDGKILIAGSNFNVARLLADGSPDPDFDGVANATFNTIGQTATCLALQNDGKIVIAGTVYDGSYEDFALARFNTDGSLDHSFDTDGKIIMAFGTSTDKINAVTLQPDDKIVVAGSWYNGINATEFALARFNPDGSLDNSFDSDGKQVISMGHPGGQASSIAIVNGDKILVAGTIFPNLGFARLNVDGSLDLSFDGDGKLMDETNVTMRCMQIEISGKILVGGHSNNIVTGNDFAILRYNADGSRDNSFDGDGRITTDFDLSYDEVYALAIQSDGKIIAAGAAEVNTNAGKDDFGLARYNYDGSLDNNFALDGKLTMNIGTSNDVVGSLALQNDGKILVGGFAENGDNNDFALVRFNANGSLDNSFGIGGKVTTSFNIDGDDNISCIAIQSDGKIVVGGSSFFADGYDFALARYNTDGSLDNSFDGDGKLTTIIGDQNDRISSIAIQNDGKIVVGGSGRLGSSNNGDFVVVRYNSNGSLDNSFDGDGKVVTSISSSNDGIASIALQSDGKIVAAGASNGDFALARYNPDGSLDNSFDSDGIVMTDINSSSDNIASMAIQSDGKIVVGGTSNFDTNARFALARYNSNGTLDNSFDGDGKLMTDISSMTDGITSIAIQTDGKIMANGTTRSVASNRFVLARYNPDGTLDNSFDDDGTIVLNMMRGDYENGPFMKLVANRIYIAGTVQTEGSPDFVLAAILNDALESPLPLRLLDFSGKLVVNDALLSWKTDSEINTREFVVERSTDGRNYYTIGSLDAVNTAGTHFYNYIDQDVASLDAAVLYYRLLQKDMDSRQTYSRIIALTVDRSNIVLFYPNPVVNEANLAITIERADRVQARIIDNQGRVVKQQQWNLAAGSTSLSIDVESLSKGVYYLELKGESLIYKRQFVK
jgi:uncharacterized delta-60 repeat protein